MCIFEEEGGFFHKLSLHATSVQPDEIPYSFHFLSSVSNNCTSQVVINSSTFLVRFRQQEEQFNQLIKTLKADTTLNFKSKSVPVFQKGELSEELQSQMETLGVKEVFLFSWGKKQKQFDLKSSWRKTFPVHLYNNTLDIVQTDKRFYRIDKYNNEAWGLRNNWAIMSVRKYVPIKQ